jgi:DNA-binding ferritin-like protein
MQLLIAYKYACKINHWATNDYGDHLLFDRLGEELDDFIDDIAEKHFMAYNKKALLKSDLLNPKLVDKNLVNMSKKIIALTEKLQKDKKLDLGIVSYLGDIEKAFLSKLAFAQLK